MPFGIPGSESSNGAAFLGRIQYDARVGFWQIIKRVPNSDGGWGDDKGEQFKNPIFLMDLGSLEVGFIHYSSPPVFLVVPYGKAIPPQPQDMQQAQGDGKPRKSFQPGFRVKVASSKTFGDSEAYYFSSNSKNTMESMDDLYQSYEQKPEAAAGQVPIVQCTGTRVVEVKNNKGGVNRFYSPQFAIVGWHDRLEVFGERTVPAPGARAPVAPAPAPIATMPPAQVAAMAAASVPQSNARPAAAMPTDWGAPSSGHPVATLSDEIPF